MEMLAFATIKELKKKIETKEIAPSELLSYFLKRFAKYDANLGSALEIFEEKSILQFFYQQGLLHGIPGIIKDNIAQQHRKLTCASKILEDYVAMYDATAISRLKKEGALLVGRANLDEFAMGSSTETSAYKKTKNPWNLDLVPGGSSGGPAAAVAAGLVPWALGSDTGGSVRQPAAFCGIVGIRPTYGLVSRYGLVAYASSLDQIGVFTRSVYDNALLLSTIAGHDLKDSSSLFVKHKDYTQKLDGNLPEGLKIGIIDEVLNAEGMDTEIASSISDAVKVFEKLGAKITYVKLPALKYSTAAYFILSRAEAASNLARFDGVRYGLRSNANTLREMYDDTRHDGFGPNVKARILVGNYVLSAGHAGEFYDHAKIVQRLIRQEFSTAFKDVDVLIMPTHPIPAFPIGAFAMDQLQLDLQDYFTCPASLSGIPAISIPCGFTNNKLPIGFQLIGPHLSEGMLYKVAYAYEQQTLWHTVHPKKYVQE